MSEISSLLTQFLTQIAKEIRDGLPSVSGKTRESVTVEVRQEGDSIFGGLTGYILAPSWIGVFERGRGPTSPGAVKGSPTLQQKLKVWIETKNFRWTKTIKKGGASIVRALTTEQMSWAMAIKMHREGNALFRRLAGGQTLVITGPMGEARINAFTKVFAEKYGRLVLVNIINGVK